MNTWLVVASAAIAAIGVVHSVTGERRIFVPWRTASPLDVLRRHQVILRASWHLPTFLGLGQAAAMAILTTTDGAPAWRMALGMLALCVGACGLAVAVATRGRHKGGVAMPAAAGLIVLGIWQGVGA